MEEWELRSPFGFLAIHGGSLELGAAEVAAGAADRAGMSFYTVRQPENLRWHIPSALVDPRRLLQCSQDARKSSGSYHGPPSSTGMMWST
ncbi:MAG: poly-gamma-glutamate hydrolase family protein [Acidimicrobiia bacterium]